MKISDYFYTEGETAKILGVNRVAIWRWIKKGKLDAQKVGVHMGVVLIPKWEVELLKSELTTKCK